MSNLNRKVGEMTYDGLISSTNPSVLIDGKTIRTTGSEVTYKRGTIFAKSDKDNKLVVLGTAAASGETLKADCILCDDITVGAAEDAIATVYIAGCFNTNKVTMAEGYSLTEADKDTLRAYGIIFKAMA